PLAHRLHEGFHLDVEERQRLPQQRKLDGALALLDQVEIGGRDAQLARHIRLLRAPLQPQLAQAAPDLRVLFADARLRRHRSSSWLHLHAIYFCKSLMISRKQILPSVAYWLYW